MWGTASAGDRAADRGRTVPVVFVHGQPGLGSDFDPVAELLAPPYLVISPDRPGYGESGRPSVSMRENVRVFASLIEEQHLGRAVVVGHSYGGGIAVLLAAERPDLVAGLVLAASVGSGEHLGTVDRLLATPLLGEMLVAGGLGAAGTVLPLLRVPGKLAPGRVGRWMAANLPDARFAKVATQRSGVWRSVVSEQRSLLREIGDIEASIPVLRLPVEIVTGTWDIIVPPVVAAATAAVVRGSELWIVPRIGHFLTRDAPRVLADAVRRAALRAETG
ncbi:MAG: alpha/beta fold hydrolase [Acidimicrobiales bacterium]